MGNRHSRAPKASRQSKTADSLPAAPKAEETIPPPAQVQAILPTPAKVEDVRPATPKSEGMPSPGKVEDSLPHAATAGTAPAKVEDAPRPTHVEHAPLPPANVDDTTPTPANVEDAPAPPPRGEDVLPSDVWRIVFKHLRHPVPPPLSRPPRSALRPKDHAALALTCKLFNTVVTPLLYHTVVTDSPGRFFAANAGNIQLPFDPLPRHLLALIHTIHIEYQDTDTSPSYARILQQGNTVREETGPNETKAMELQMRRCEDEFINLYFPLLSLYSATREAPRFPRLTTVSVGSIYGHQGDMWSHFGRGQGVESWQRAKAREVAVGGINANFLKASTYMWDDFLTTNEVTQVCIRDPSAPLSFALQRPQASGAHLPHKTVHFSHDIPGANFPPGQNPTWVSDVPRDQDWAPMHAVIADGIIRTIGNRGGKPNPLQLDVFGSTTRLGSRPAPSCDGDTSIHRFAAGVPGAAAKELSVGTQRAVAAVLGSPLEVQTYLPGGAPGDSNRWSDDSPIVRDTIRWFASHDYSGCASCGSGPPL